MKFKSKLKRNKLLLMTILLIQFSQMLFLQAKLDTRSKDKQEPWCWTKPLKGNEKKNLKKSMGGLNWGFCTSDSDPRNQKVNYKITVNTANIPEAGASGSFYITVFGENGSSKEMQLSSNGFSIGESTVIKLNGKNVGDVNKIKIRNGGSLIYN